jgi:hypothetical protein
MNRILLIAVVFAISQSCTAASLASDGIAGDWTGESICTVKNSPCHDEHVIYHISEPDPNGKLKIDADKIVNGKPEFMGTIDCTFDKKASTLVCPMNNGLWEFSVSGTKMEGTLKLSDGTLFRRINVAKKS